jgi:acetoin:2,6-dichlorophenolindophenol oxidoreductase subunit alpha
MPKKSKSAKKRPEHDIVAHPQRVHGANGDMQIGSNLVDLRKLYSSLLRTRRVQEYLRDFCNLGGRYELAIGREAVVVGATANLNGRDTVLASPRNLAARIAKGAALEELLEERNCQSCLPSTLTEDPFNLGAGIALAHRLEQKHGVVIAIAPAPKPVLETWNNSLKFAATHKLPIVFVIENGISTDAPTRDDAPHLEAHSYFARDYGFPGIVVDGNDPVAVWRVAQEATHHARSGSGPTLIDCRTNAETDPLAHMEHYLRKRNGWSEEWRVQLDSELKQSLKTASTAPIRR